MNESDHKQSVDWMRSQPLGAQGMTLHRVYFYHMHKTGGTTLQTFMSIAYNILLQELKARQISIPPQGIARLDDEDNLDPSIFTNQNLFISSHLPYPFHKRFSTPFELITFVREPFKRLYSLYTYEAMRTDTKPTNNKFEEFVKNEKNRNVQAKTLAGVDLNTSAKETDALEIAWVNLTNEFAYFGTTQHINRIGTHLLSQSCLPNILTERLNQTKSNYQFDASHMQDLVLSLNAEDTALYERICESPRLPPEPSKETPPNPATLVSFEDVTSSSKAFFSRTSLIPTSEILPILNEEKCTRSNFDVLVKKIIDGLKI